MDKNKELELKILKKIHKIILRTPTTIVAVTPAEALEKYVETIMDRINAYAKSLGMKIND